MSYSIRAARGSDVPWIVSQLRDLSDFYATRHPLFPGEEMTADILTRFMPDNIVLVCERGPQLVGFIVGAVTPHFMNPAIKMASHFFWWVVPAFRHTRAAAMLLKQFVAEAKSRACSWITLNISGKSPVNPNALRRMGFNVSDVTFLLEAA